MTFTLKVMIGGTVRLAEPMTFERWRQVAPTLDPLIPTLNIPGPVAMVAVSHDSEDNVIHILGRWR